MATAIGDLLKWFNGTKQGIEYDRLAGQLVPADPKEIDLHSSSALMGIVCQRTGLAPTEWKKLSTLERLPWLREAAGVDDQAVAGGAQIDESADQSGRLIAAMGETAFQVCQIAEGKGTVEERMRLIVALDLSYRGKNSEDWAALLNCTPQNIRKIWKAYPELRYETRD